MITVGDIKNILLILRRGVGIGTELIKSLGVIFKELRAVIDLDRPISDNIKDIKSILSGKLTEELNKSMFAIGVSTVKAFPDLKPINITQALIDRSLQVIMPDSNISTSDMIKRADNLTESSVINYVHQAYNEGWTSRQLANALKTTELQADRYIKTIANTAVNAVSNQTKRELYKANDDVIDRVLFSSTLDSRTSNICKSLDGTAYKLDDAPRLPLHPNERSQLLPILIGEDVEQVKSELLPRPAVEPKNKTVYDKQGLKTSTGKTRKPSKTDRSPLKGVQSQSEDYESLLRKQPAYYQDDIIGKEAGKEFRKGEKLTKVIIITPITESYLKKAI